MSDNGPMKWTPATVTKVKEIIQRDLARCDAEQKAAFHSFSVEPHFVPILRYSRTETVVVVAERGTEILYWEDVEEGFATSPTDDEGRIFRLSCDQDTLGIALNRWIEGRSRH